VESELRQSTATLQGWKRLPTSEGFSAVSSSVFKTQADFVLLSV
jgi:hypothetical protein